MMEDKSKIKILIVDDEAPIREILSASLRDENYTVYSVADGDSGLKAIRDFRPDVVFQDIWMPGSVDGIEVLTTARKLYPDVEFVMISGHGTIETAVKATKLGAWDFIEKPLSMDKIFIIISHIMSYKNEKEEKNLLLNKLRKSIALVGESPALGQIKQMVSRVAPTQSWVLMIGDDGVGKQLTAENIHYMSSRASRPFVYLKISSIPEDLQEIEIFGAEKGVLPGVEKTIKGKLDLADGGTLFIHDLVDLKVNVQTRLLQYMQEKKYLRMGGDKYINADVRVIIATSKFIEKDIKNGKVDEAFYHRLNAFTIKIPPLKDRFEDIPLLVSHFSDEIMRQGGYPLKTFSEAAMMAMKNHQWSGNIRELKNFIERVYILTPGEYVDAHDLRFAGLVESSSVPSANIDTDAINTFREARAIFEKDYLIKKIIENGGNISKTAEMIGLERSYLHRKIKAYEIEDIIKEKI